MAKTLTLPPTAAALSQDAAAVSSVVQRTQASRNRLHARLNSVVLFPAPGVSPSQPQPGDHPLIQVALRLRDHIDAMAEAAQTDPRMLTSAITDLGKLVIAATAEASRAGDDARAQALEVVRVELRAMEHQDKMDLLSRKTRGASDAPTTADLLRALADG